MNEIELLSNQKRKNLAGIKMELIKEKGACEICGYHFKPILQIHHIEPLHIGGSDELTNLAILCPNCHKMIHALDSSYSDNFGGADYVDDWLDINVSAKRKQTYIKYVLSILRKRSSENFPEIFKEVMGLE